MSVWDRFLIHRTSTSLATVLRPLAAELPEFMPFTKIMTTHDNAHLVSRLYHLTQTLRPTVGGWAKTAWEGDLPHPLTDKMWTYCCEQTQYVSNKYKHKRLHFKYLHRMYVTPMLVAKMNRAKPDNCQRCAMDHAYFIDLAWNCPAVLAFWESVFEHLFLMVETNVTPSPLPVLLGYALPLWLCLWHFTAIALLLAKRQVSLDWAGICPPLVKAWLMDLMYCDNTSHVYSSLLPPSSRPKSIW